MNRFVVAALVAACLAVAWAYSAYLKSNRYVITNAGGGTIYKTDQQTGKTTVLYEGKELEVQQYVFVQPTPTPEPTPQTPESTAIALAQSAITLDSVKINSYFLSEWLKQQKGEIRFDGWGAKQVDDQTFLVTYTVVRDGKREGVRFEVNLAAQLVRNVKGDPALEQKYSDK